MVKIYTDGSARGNPGPGGYGLLVQFSDTAVQERSGGYRRTTNNRMELMAVIVALEILPKEPQDVTIYTDSQYIVNAVEKGWLKNWLKTNFKGKKNSDLWKKFWRVYLQHHVALVWIRGHAGHPQNEYCDRLAVKSSYGPLEIDRYYEQTQSPF